MTTQVIDSSKHFDFTNFTIQGHGNKSIIKDNSNIDWYPKIVIKDCKVVFYPLKFKRMTVSIPNKSIPFITSLEAFIKQSIPVREILKNGNQLAFNVPDMYLEELKNIQRISTVDIVLNFNQIWRVRNDYHASFNLEQFRENEQEMIDYLSQVN